ncbi:MAG: hypothetical protein JSC189_000492 [Candidatus Tokpelaia sp. JSC189]|nr:MAG: hypothetical protein JSC189_000492 [Candidatus Tokpelaia sp. JSC189]
MVCGTVLLQEDEVVHLHDIFLLDLTGGCRVQ